jgi:hypothetical protein
VRKRFNELFEAWHNRVCEWVKVRNIEKLEAIKAQERLEEQIKAKIAGKKDAVLAKTHFKPPAIVYQDSPLIG